MPRAVQRSANIPAPQRTKAPSASDSRDVRRQPKIFSPNELVHISIQSGGHRIRSVRRNADTQGFALVPPAGLDLFTESSHRFHRLRFCRTEHFLIGNSLKTEFAHRLPGRAQIHHLPDTGYPGASISTTPRRAEASMSARERTLYFA